MPHRKIIREWLKPLSDRSTLRAFVLLLVDTALFMGLVACTVLLESVWLKLLCGSAAGFVIGRLFIIGHDACHQSLTPHRELNKWIGRYAFLYSLTPFSLWDTGHNVVHHGYTNLKGVSELNPKLKDTQFADYHGHGWNFRAIYKRNRKGTLLDAKGKEVSDEDPEKFKKAVHLSSIHLDLGMHCVDCHFSQDMHGNGHIYGEVAAAIEIDCADCHGTATKYPTLFTSGPAAQPGGRDLSLMRTQDGRRRFEWRDGKLYQRASLDPSLEWEMTLHEEYPCDNKKALERREYEIMSEFGEVLNKKKQMRLI